MAESGYTKDGLRTLPALRQGFVDTHRDNGYMLTHEKCSAGFYVMLKGTDDRVMLNHRFSDVAEARRCYTACKDIMQTVEVDNDYHPEWCVEYHYKEGATSLKDISSFNVFASCESQARLKAWLRLQSGLPHRFLPRKIRP